MANPNLQDILNVMEIDIEITREEDGVQTLDTTSTPVTDACTQANVNVMGNSPTVAADELHQILSQSASLTSQNAVNTQQQLTTTHQAATSHDLKRFLLPKLHQKNPKAKSAFEASLHNLIDIMKTLENLSS